MNTNCLQKKIANATGILQPTILTAILDIYNRGLHLITAREVKERCRILNNFVPWDGRINAICNAMRNTTECGFYIVGEDVSSNDFTISFDDNISISEKPKEQIISKVINNDGIVKSVQENFELNLSKNFKVVMICASDKNDGGVLKYNEKIVKFYAQRNIEKYEFLPDDYMPGPDITWRNYVIAIQNPNSIPMMAFQLYKKEVYRKLFNRYGESFYILSAGWGLVRATYRLPNYDITFSNNAENNKIRNYNPHDQYHDFNHLSEINEDEDIIYIGGKDYLPLFYELTQDLQNRKIVYWKAKDIPMPQKNKETFIFRFYEINYNQNWHYELAETIATGIIP